MAGAVDAQVCLFSYGQTGAGKTHTMQGTASPDGRGITPRALDQVPPSTLTLNRVPCNTAHNWLHLLYSNDCCPERGVAAICEIKRLRPTEPAARQTLLLLGPGVVAL